MSEPAPTARDPVLLVVDDEPLNRDLLRRVLHSEYDIHEAEDAPSALTTLSTAPVDVVLCDHIMPGQSGADLSRVLQVRLPHIVFILLTGYEDAPEVEAARKAGAIFEVVGKPWVARMLRESIVRALAEAARRRATPAAP